MKRKIIFIRHGESADKQPGQRDFDRVLTGRGELSIVELGKVLRSENLLITRLISSSAIRAKHTAVLISRELNCDENEIEFDESLFKGTDENYLGIVTQESLIIVGHNPAISFAIGRLVGNFSISLSPGQAAVLEIEMGNEKGKLVKLLGPFIPNNAPK